jgi:hypothetical protein
VSVALLVPGKLAESAEKIADAASGLATFVADNTDKHAGELLVKPNFASLVESVEDFSRTAVADAARSHTASGSRRRAGLGRLWRRVSGPGRKAVSR